jgi:hypothetical protein
MRAITHDGVTDTVEGWSKRLGIPHQTLKGRLWRGWPVERALTPRTVIITPAKKARHGKTNSSEYRCWCNMRQRCENPSNTKFALYGGRGIRVCERWLSFENFLADMGPRPSLEHSLDRIDPERGYEPGNVRWATFKEQGANLRKTILVELDGERMSLREAAKRIGVHHATLSWRIRQGWSLDRALARGES